MEPLTVSVKPPEPAMALFGEIEVVPGPGLLSWLVTYVPFAPVRAPEAGQAPATEAVPL